MESLGERLPYKHKLRYVSGIGAPGRNREITEDSLTYGFFAYSFSTRFRAISFGSMPNGGNSGDGMGEALVLALQSVRGLERYLPQLGIGERKAPNTNVSCVSTPADGPQ